LVELSDDPTAEQLADSMGGPPDDPIQSLRPASVGPPDARICSVGVPNRWLDAPIRWMADRIRPDWRHCSSPTRLNRA
jgi:hypothetical protein